MFNTDRGSQFTSPASTGALLALGIQVSPDEYGIFGMDGKGCYLDNIFVERLWRSIKY
jgi:putative transposase